MPSAMKETAIRGMRCAVCGKTVTTPYLIGPRPTPEHQRASVLQARGHTAKLMATHLWCHAVAP